MVLVCERDCDRKRFPRTLLLAVSERRRVLTGINLWGEMPYRLCLIGRARVKAGGRR